MAAAHTMAGVGEEDMTVVLQENDSHGESDAVVCMADSGTGIRRQSHAPSNAASGISIMAASKEGPVVTSSADSAKTRLATRLAFLVAGFGIACWAPLVPYAKQRLTVDSGTFGMLLLCLGIGSVMAMPLTGMFSSRAGSKSVIIAGALGLVIFLPVLAFIDSMPGLAITLFFFGASLGSIDVAMNIHAIEVEKAADRPLMSGFHALFSIGGFAGALLMTLLLTAGLRPLLAAVACAALIAATIMPATPHLLQGPHEDGDGPLFAMPHGIVLLLAMLAIIGFLAEGVILDWSALFVVNQKLLDPAHSGLGYVVFSIAMAAGRLCGDIVATRFGDRPTLQWGGSIVIVGFVLLLVAFSAFAALFGFALIGLGAANIVPILFRRAGSQTVMPRGLAIAAITTAGYAGVLAGPAFIGFLAQVFSLWNAFLLLMLLFCIIPLLANKATQ